jgi:hypothetical protein
MEDKMTTSLPGGPDSSKKLDVFLAEYKALRDELLGELRLRHQLTLLTWAIAGALFAFALKDAPARPLNVTPSLALLVIPVVTTIIFVFWSETQGRIESFHVYQRDFIAPCVRALFGDAAFPQPTDGTLLGWESSEVRAGHRRSRTRFRMAYTLATYGLLPLTALGLLATAEPRPGGPTAFIALAEFFVVVAVAIMAFRLDLTRARNDRPSGTAA